MKLYFKAGANKRLMLDTENKVYCTNYAYLGGWKQYIKISVSDMRDLVADVKRIGGYEEVDSF